MSTRSLIAVKTESGYRSVYCHSDGYPAGVGRILKEHYCEDVKVAALMRLGNLCILGSEIGAEHDYYSHCHDAKYQESCLAFGRDRNDPNQEAKEYASEQEFLDAADASWARYVYAWDGRTWSYRPVGVDAEWHELKG